jgi:hypothetical protein
LDVPIEPYTLQTDTTTSEARANVGRLGAAYIATELSRRTALIDGRTIHKNSFEKERQRIVETKEGVN